MEAVTLPTVAEFLHRAGPLLAADEARHNLILGIAGILRDRPEVYPEFALWVVEAEGGPAAAALMTPPHNLVLADAAVPAALPVLAAAVRASGRVVPGVLGNRPAVDLFNEAWAPLAGVTPALRMAQGVFALEEVRPVPPAPGAARPGGEADRDLILEWLEAFTAEALPWEEFAAERTGRGVARVLNVMDSAAGIWLWEDEGRPVSLVAYGGPTPGGIRLGPVYTPPERRRRGYATALVAAVSAWLRQHGRRRCFLYTDLANPTSNAIYRRIGYEQVAESAEYAYLPS
ncbi:MAG: GNAT family N-acetyltransferase [Actinobacteria bacterium]|nr:GNAT family N-acetyltransferase [Actinomycetota bacterium]